MIKEALEYIVGLKTPVITEIDGNTYSDKPLNRIGYVPYGFEYSSDKCLCRFT